MPVTTATSVHALRLHPGDDLKRSLLAFAKTYQLSAAWIITCVGSLEVCHLRFAGRDTGFSASGPFEIVSLVGTLSSTAAHVHASLADAGGRLRGGHLLYGNLVYTTAELVVGSSAELSFGREVDETYGYRELVVKPAPGSPRR